MLLTRRGMIGLAASGLWLPSGGEARAPLHVRSHPPAILRQARKRPVIMLDPGHGGKDPGAIGVSGTYEKHVSVAVAQELRRLLMHSGQYQVVLSREDDHFIPLEGRVERAHRHKAQLFMSIHADALHQATVRGASVYTLSHKASDHQTALLAATENSADRYAGSSIQGVSPDVEQILGSLVSEETRRGSAHMAASVIDSFQNHVRLLRHPVRHAHFVVLKSADIPSVLVEMGFMSNHLDEQALRMTRHRQKVAHAMKQAIDRYFMNGAGYAQLNTSRLL
ncbi:MULTISPECIES: N-acetylmuramoyl-L-alanine amidase [unclassified Saccharibacter]|uniref:N-acetylmuramoyl-L-alanine amidase family protein n=1 Tax=unclassified Saccharibacter TaxID=2648722 RepID=UPI0013292BD6|nr:MULTISPECIES: N-acetylmuramoyl-L-alanine amidase [unclassified Saccharibacter]MXV36068.1 N-acetylmuramoyl-L-alanine amidase [Saccharibacter sp. EH611]MXV56927.1 N-acetylmuramoyl-L-alanine amidase [Saccharibacter sp. EH70]MXV66713.1 N-acetylmuramoyl-L-alanine amidase [Saccharibacter sp. EH60]